MATFLNTRALAKFVYDSGRQRLGTPVCSVNPVVPELFMQSGPSGENHRITGYPGQNECDRVFDVQNPSGKTSDFILYQCESCANTHLSVLLREKVCMYVTLESVDSTISEFCSFARQMYLKYLIHHLSKEIDGIKEIEVVGTDDRLLHTIELAYVSSFSSRPVLIYGETGTGKELWAQAIHLFSARRSHPFITINCAHLRDSNMAASRLFGHKKGAFTGAYSDRLGAFRKADGGTVFLDEIESLPLHAQEMLLRAIEYGEIQSLGTDTPVQVDVRIIAATNQQLKHLMERGKLREDFYYRIATHYITLPPLRDRTAGDITALARHFLQQYNRERPLSKYWSKKALNSLLNYGWPGNVRELQNVVDSAFYTSDMKECISHRHLPYQLQNEQPKPAVHFSDRSGMIDRLYLSLVDENADFWEMIHLPYLQGDLSRYQIQDLIELALLQHESLRDVSKAFHINEGDWRKFYLFLYRTIFRGDLPQPVSTG